MSRFRCGIVTSASLLLQFPLLIGCNRGPTPIHVPDFDPLSASQQAMDMYDTNHNGELSEQELSACPGILLNRTTYDTNHNGTVSAQEIEQRLHSLRTAGVGLTTLCIDVRLNGRPLHGADVKLIPEAYLGSNVKPASGKTSRRGIAIMDVGDEDLPAAEKGTVGVHYGTYKVEITHPSLQIPTKYNKQTTLGYETQRGNPDYRFELKSR